MSDANRHGTSCPYIGLADDPHTLISLPSVSNCCHFCRPLTPVSVDHQLRFCLTKNHMQCPVHLQMRDQQLPVELRYLKVAARAGGWNRILVPAFFIILVLTSVIIWMSGLNLDILRPEISIPVITLTPAHTAQPNIDPANNRMLLLVALVFLVIGVLLFYAARMTETKEE